jgi:hypothetical protein
MVVSYTRDLLEQLTGARPEPDNDGDLPIEYGGASLDHLSHYLPFCTP